MRIRFLIDFLSSSPGMSTRLPLEALLKRCSIVVCCVCCTSLSSWICWARRISVTGTICNGRQGTERTHKYSVQQRHRQTQRDTDRHRETQGERESEKAASTPAATAARICILQIQLLEGRIVIAFAIAIEIQFKKRLQINCSFSCRLSFASDFSSFSTDFSLFCCFSFACSVLFACCCFVFWSHSRCLLFARLTVVRRRFDLPLPVISLVISYARRGAHPAERNENDKKLNSICWKNKKRISKNQVNAAGDACNAKRERLMCPR